jgi:beta-lactamase regulating signal transducer with metallopeptidase domain
MTASFNELHSLILYIVFGYTLLLPLTLLTLKLLGPLSSLQRLRIYLIAFLAPIAAFVLYHTVLVKRCEENLPPFWAENAFHFLCAVSEGMLRVFIPLLGILATVALFKAAAAALLVKRLKVNGSSVDQADSNRLKTMIAEKSDSAGITPPQLIFSNRDGFAAFTAGFIKPVIVINSKIVSLLNNREIEALISHELIHIRSRDTLKSWLLYLIRDIALLNPLSALLLKEYLVEKEVLCDQKAIELTGQNPKEYASLLLKVWKTILDNRPPAFAAVSSFTGAGGMERRINALLHTESSNTKLSAFISTLAGFALFTVTLLLLGYVC